MMRVGAAVVVILIVGCGGAPPPQSPCQLRAARTTAAGSPEPSDGSFRELLLGGGHGSTSCDGRPIEPDLACPASAAAWSILAEPRVVLRRRIDEQWHAVWVATMGSADGEALGPMALVAQTATGLHVKAAGIVRGPAERPSVERYRIGERSLWLVTGERCAQQGQQGCDRLASLYELHGESLVPLSWAGSAPCPATLELQTTLAVTAHTEPQARRQQPQARRRAMATTVVEPVEGGLALVETVTVEEHRGQGLPPTVVHEASARRLLRLTPSGLEVLEPPLMSRFREAGTTNFDSARNSRPVRPIRDSDGW